MPANPLPRATSRRLIPLVAFAAIALGSGPAFALLPQIGAGGTPPGWYGPAVPRNTADATNGSALLPFQLSPMTYFNWSISHNAAVQGTWRDEFYLDGELIQVITRSNTEFASRWWLAINTGPMIVEGGRHTLKIYADAGNQVGESIGSRGDNIWSGQYLWQPTPLAPGSSRYSIPPEGTLDGPDPPDCNACEFTRTPGTAWVVSLGTNPSNAALVVYDDYVNSTTGLTNERGRSTRVGLTNFVVGAATGTPASVYPAILRSFGTSTAPVTIAGADASGRQSPNGVGLWPSVNLPANQSAHVYEAYLTAGYGESAVLTRFLGSSDLEVTVFPPGIPVMSRNRRSGSARRATGTTSTTTSRSRRPPPAGTCSWSGVSMGSSSPRPSATASRCSPTARSAPRPATPRRRCRPRRRPRPARCN